MIVTVMLDVLGVSTRRTLHFSFYAKRTRTRVVSMDGTKTVQKFALLLNEDLEKGLSPVP